MSLLLKTLLIVVWPAVNVLSKSVKTKPILRSVGLMNCDDKMALPNYFTDVTITNPRRDQSFINARYVANRVGSSKLTANLEISKCQTRDAKDCEYFMKLSFPKVCERMVQKGQFWSPFFYSSNPPMACPFNRKDYVMRNMTLDVEKVVEIVNAIPMVMDFFWMGKVTIFEKKELISCFKYIVKLEKVKA